MQPGIDRLRDIQGIGEVPWWPLAPGWWLLLGGVLLAGFLAYRWRTILRLRVPIPGITLGTWRWDAAAALRDLRRRAQAGQDAKVTLSELSELLRRISMARLGRDACAGLTGDRWLGWLADNDPNGFPWHERGKALLDVPYAPPGRPAGRDLYNLIDAAYGWVSAPNRRRRRAEAQPRERRSLLPFGRRGRTRAAETTAQGKAGPQTSTEDTQANGRADRPSIPRQSQPESAPPKGVVTARPPEPGRV